jgi:diguanylate cyclase (GGDEF)-like protein
MLASLRSREQFIGVLVVGSREPGIYSDRDVTVTGMFAEQTAAAVENARLFGEVRRLSITDSLTGLYSRRHFFELAEREFQRARRYGSGFAIIMVDIDNFKKINDTHGHLCGDEVLRAVGVRLKDAVRTTDILGRYGGEEFGIALCEIPLGELLPLCTRLVQTIGMKHVNTREAGPLRVTASFGVAYLREDTTTLASLMERADSALYAAKRNGKNRFEME